MHVLVFDAETDGLLGDPFAIGWVVLNGDGIIMEESSIRMRDPQLQDEWVKENILPIVLDMRDSQICDTSDELCELFWQQWCRMKKQYPDLLVAVDCGYPIESNVLRRAQVKESSRTWEGPFPLHEVASFCLMVDMNPTSRQNRKEDELPEHNPCKDSLQSCRLVLNCLNKQAHH